MKKWLIYMGITLVFTLGFQSHEVDAGSSFEQGFQEIAWGTHKKDLPDIGLSKGMQKNIYEKGESAIMFLPGVGKLDLTYGGVPLISLYLRFRDAVFYGVDMVFNKTDQDKIYARLAEEFKSTGRSDETVSFWETDTLRVELTDRELMIVYRSGNLSGVSMEDWWQNADVSKLCKWCQ